jgi:hypothetical protein
LATKELAVASLQHTVSYFFFHQGTFDQKQHDSHLHPPYLSLLLRLKEKTERPSFDIIEVIEAESQAVVNTLTEHDFQDAVKKWQKRWEWCICMEGDYFEDDGSQ